MLDLPVLRSSFFFQAEDGIRDVAVTGVQTCALPISSSGPTRRCSSRPVDAGGDGALEHLLVGPLEVPETFGAAGGDAYVSRLLHPEIFLAARFDSREFELFPEHLGELVEGDVHFEDMVAWRVSRLPRPPVRIGGAQDRPHLAVTLADPSDLAVTENELGDRDLG